jgi:tetratricopeptide (TPR) repeat protein
MVILLPGINLKSPKMSKAASLLSCLLLFVASSGYAFKGDHKSEKKIKHNRVSAVDTAQKITLQAAKEINLQAQSALSTLGDILNSIAFNDNAPSELDGYIKNSFTPGQRSRVFYSKDIIIENDIDPKFAQGEPHDIGAEKYLNDFDLQYDKSADFSIKFSNFVFSDIKKTDHIYIRVKYDSKFGNKFKKDGTTYPLRQREALVRMEPNGKSRWFAFIEGISYYDPKLPIDSKDHDVQVVSADSTAGAGAVEKTVTPEEIQKEMEQLIKDKEAALKKNEEQFASFVTNGDNYRKVRQYQDAMDAYKKAEQINPLNPALEKKIADVKKLMEQDTYEYWKGKGDKANGDRDFKTAIKAYNIAISKKNSESAALQPIVDRLSRFVALISKPDNLLQSGDLQGAIDECNNTLKKENKKEPSKYPELWLIEGKAYEKMALNKGDDNSDLDRALKCYNSAIENFTNFKAALLARENFYENVRPTPGFALAINDYDALITNELDESADKPKYLALRAKVKDKRHSEDWPKSAIADYNLAIALSRNIAIIKDTVLGKREADLYFVKGEIQYRSGINADAAASLDSAIIINPKLTDAYFFRGLNYVKGNNNAQAGVDFAKAEQLSLAPVHLSTVDSLSFEFFVKGRGLSATRDFVNADSAFDNALRIRPCNANAIHGKAEIRLIAGNELYAKKDTAGGSDKFKESITLNTNALNCKKDFSDADFKSGLAHVKLKEYDLAITSFTRAIKTDAKNVQAFVERGKVQQKLGKYSKAAEDFTSAVALFNDNLEVVKKSNDSRTRFMLVNDSLSIAYHLKGAALYFNKDYANAIIALNASLELNHHDEAYYYLALVYLDQPQRELSRAKDDLKEAIKIKQDSRYFYASGKAYFYDKDYLTSISNFGDAIRLDSANDQRDKYYRRGYSYFKNKNYPEALADYDVYNKYSYAKNDTSFFADYGIAQLFAGKDTAAAKSFNIALSKSKNNAIALYGIGCYYAKTGEAFKALDSFKSAFSTHQLSKDDIKVMEDTFLTDFLNDKNYKSQYKTLKKLNSGS